MTDLVAAPVPLIRFSSEDLPEETRMEYLRDFYSRTRIGAEITPMIEDEKFRLDLAVQPLLGDTWVGRGLMTPHRATRTAVLASATNNDGVLLTRCTGRFIFSDRHTGEMPIETHDVLMANFNQTCEYVYLARDTVQTLAIDRTQLLNRLPGFEPEVSTRFDGRSPALSLLFAYAEAISRESVGSTMLGQVAAMHLADLAALALGVRGDHAEAARESGQKAARFALIKADLEQDFQNTELSAAAVAHRHGISVRYLHVLFEQSGQTFGDFVLERRLRFAMSRLTDPRCRHLRVADIAFDSGFADLTTFNRAFRRRFGATPSSVRP
ncbi:helix-turn-helix transcriptional regulator [Pseudoxanthomonas sp. LjRoot143]|uniref:helix-turn-helix transcriptional regulator n=1 Tax=Pseudoxanthomonas sp. LjRoot143 TaxID=3342266 RepID=UPI003ED04060